MIRKVHNKKKFKYLNSKETTEKIKKIVNKQCLPQQVANSFSCYTTVNSDNADHSYIAKNLLQKPFLVGQSNSPP